MIEFAKYTDDERATMISAGDVDVDPLIETLEDARDFHELSEAPTDRLVAEGLRLLDMEADLDGREDRAAIRGSLAHADALERYCRIGLRLQRTIRELAGRSIDLHEIDRARQA